MGRRFWFYWELRLVRSLRADDAFIDGLAAGEAFVGAVPVGDGVFSRPPAEQDDAAFDFAGKIEQADVDIFDLDADGIDFGESVFGALLGLGALGLAAGDGYYIDVSAAVEEDAVIERLHLGFNVFHDLLAADGGAQERFEHGKKRLGFVESEGSVGHLESILPHVGERQVATGFLAFVDMGVRASGISGQRGQWDLPFEGSGDMAAFTSTWSFCAAEIPGG